MDPCRSNIGGPDLCDPCGVVAYGQNTLVSSKNCRLYCSPETTVRYRIYDGSRRSSDERVSFQVFKSPQRKSDCRMYSAGIAVYSQVTSTGDVGDRCAIVNRIYRCFTASWNRNLGATSSQCGSIQLTVYIRYRMLIYIPTPTVTNIAV